VLESTAPPPSSAGYRKIIPAKSAVILPRISPIIRNRLCPGDTTPDNAGAR
jgi:hypothetical protein